MQCSAGERTQAAMHGKHAFWMHSSGRDWISRVNFRLQAPSRSQPVTHNLQENADLGFVGKAPNPPSVPVSFGIFSGFVHPACSSFHSRLLLLSRVSPEAIAHMACGLCMALQSFAGLRGLLGAFNPSAERSYIARK